MSVDSSSFLKRLDLGHLSLHDALCHAVDLYRADPLFCVPARIQALRDNCKVILLGSKDFSLAFILDAANRVPILGVVDDFKAGKGEHLGGVEIISTQDMLRIAKDEPNLICINGCRYDYSKRYFMDVARNHNIPLLQYEQAVRLFGWSPERDFRLGDWSPVIAQRFNEFLTLADHFADDYSRETLYAVLLFHLTCDAEWYLNIMRPYITLYFRSGLFYLSENEKLVDCGASIGESTSALIGITGGNFGHSWMIEPDTFNIQTLGKLISKYEGTPIHSKLTLFPVAVGDTKMRASFHHAGGHGGTVNLSAGGSDIQIERIDDLIDDTPTMVKMDLEGFEMAALRGAKQTLLASHPKLTISAYHRSTDLLDIPNFVADLGLDYKIGLRHHTEDRWDTCLYFYR
jgi:FkbM family methyltransferase